MRKPEAWRIVECPICKAWVGVRCHEDGKRRTMHEERTALAGKEWRGMVDDDGMRGTLYVHRGPAIPWPAWVTSGHEDT